MIDLRSDTVTQPTTAMRAAMASAVVGDDVYGEDPTVNELQAAAAALLGKEAALFVTSGTQGNLCGLLAHCGRGDEYIVGDHAHTYMYEGGGGAVLGSIQPQPVPRGDDGMIDLAAAEAAVKSPDHHFARTRLLCLENTVDGKVLTVAQTGVTADACPRVSRPATSDGAVGEGWTTARAAAAAGSTGEARAASTTAPAVHVCPGDPGLFDGGLGRAGGTRHGLSHHLDGARLPNAAVALGVSPAAVAAPFDSVSVCLSKGLGAPMGSVLAGSAGLIDEAHKWRKMLGGGLRQAGIVAAAGLHALEHHIDRLADDHANAARLADGLASIDGVKIDSCATNMVFIRIDDEVCGGSGLGGELAERGIVTRWSGSQARLVTHLHQTRVVEHHLQPIDVSAEDIETVIDAFAELLA